MLESFGLGQGKEICEQESVINTGIRTSSWQGVDKRHKTVFGRSGVENRHTNSTFCYLREMSKRSLCWRR